MIGRKAPLHRLEDALAEIERLNEDREKYFLENLEMKSKIERLRREIGILKSLLAQYEKP